MLFFYSHLSFFTSLQIMRIKNKLEFKTRKLDSFSTVFFIGGQANFQLIGLFVLHESHAKSNLFILKEIAANKFLP